MLTPSSTTLRAWHRHCAAAALRQLRGEEIDRRPFGVGVAAHACLEAMAGDRKDPLKAARQAASALMFQRIYKGHPEPPYSPDHVAEGLRLATAWLEEVATPKGKAEVGIAVDREWRLAEYGSPDVWYSQLLDLVRVFDDEDDEGNAIKVLKIEDYKTSWAAGMAEVDSLQMRGAACLGVALAERERCSAVEIQIGNLRRKRWYPREPRRFYFRRPDMAHEMDRWRAEIARAVAAIGSLRTSEPDAVASPGAGCLGCPYRDRCAPAKEAAHALGGFAGLGDPVAAAEAYLAARAQLEALETELRIYTTDLGPIPLPDGRELGHYPQDSAELTENAIPCLAEALKWTAYEESLARNLAISGGNVRKLLREMHRREGADHAALDGLERRIFANNPRAMWGVMPRADFEIPGLEPHFEPDE